jgi:hypothetical protein
MHATTLVTPLAQRLVARESYHGQPVAIMPKGTVETVLGTVQSWGPRGGRSRHELVVQTATGHRTFNDTQVEVYAA